MLVHVAPRFRDITDVRAFQAVSPYQTVIAQDGSTEMAMPLPPEFTEHRLYLMHGSLRLATVDLAFHSEHGLVNLSLFVIPREWFKRKAVRECVRLAVFPYLRQHYPDAPMVPQMEDVYLFPDRASGLTFQVRTHLSDRMCVGIGVAIVDTRNAP